MDKNNYLKLCGIVAVVTVLSILFIPGLSEFIENELLVFLMTNARA
jgi:hypothetical protein|tara:strand:+ start:500 stop:637 length:138 start_codon:yes stop_codon:yes gene_type:complete